MCVNDGVVGDVEIATTPDTDGLTGNIVEEVLPELDAIWL